MSDPTIVITLKIVSLKAGDYHPAEFQADDMKIAVHVPLDDEHIHNCTTIVEVMEDHGTPPAPVLTTTGLRNLYNQLRSSFTVQSDGGKINDTSSTDDGEDDGWE